MIKILRLVILLWSLTALPMTGQTVFTGRVTDLSGQGLPHVFVKACPAGRPTALAYVQSDQQGAYILKVGKDAGKELDVRFSAVGYAEIIRRVPNRSAQVDVSLQATDKQLHEVTVKAPTVRQRGDTVTYNVGRLQTKADRTIEDVIGRIPGIKVEESGQITYNGSPINRFYIEGLDMLDGRYNLATRNIRPDDVAAIDVYERHQPIRMLRQVEPSNRAAINLRLRKGRLSRPVGYVQAGSGWGNKVKGSAEAFLMWMGTSHQHLGNFKADNFSKDYTTELQSLYEGGQEGMQPTIGQHTFPDRLASSSFLPASRYVNTRSLLASANQLFKLRDGLTLAVQTEYAATGEDYALEMQTDYLTSGESTSVMVKDDHQASATKHQAHLTLKWERNDSLRYLNDRLQLQGAWTRHRFTFGRSEVRQRNLQEACGLHNLLQWKARIGKRILSFYSQLQLSQTPQQAMAATLPDGQAATFDTLRQSVEGLSFYSYHATSLDWLLGKNGKGGTLGLGVSFRADYHQLDLAFVQRNGNTSPSPSQTFSSPSPSASADAQLLRGMAGLNYKIIGRHASFTASLPIRLNHLRYADHSLNRRTRYQRPQLAPSMECNWIVSRSVRFSFQGQHVPIIGQLDEWLDQPVRTTYRMVSHLGNGQLPLTKFTQLQGQLFWNDPSIGRHLRLDGSYSRQASNLLADTHVSTDGQMNTRREAFSAVSHHWNGTILLSRACYGPGLYLTLLASLNTNRAPLRIDGQRISQRGHSWHTLASAEKQWFDRRLSVLLKASASGSTSKAYGHTQRSTSLNEYGGTLRVTTLPHDKVQVSAQSEWRFSQMPSTKAVKQCFLDADVQWAVAKNVTLALQGRNLAHARTLRAYRFSAADIVTTTYYLRPAECLLTCKWNF